MIYINTPKDITLTLSFLKTHQSTNFLNSQNPKVKIRHSIRHSSKEEDKVLSTLRSVSKKKKKLLLNNRL
jgi:hypothetical protein